MSIEEQIQKIEEELRLTPKNKATEKAIKALNARLAELRRELKKAGKKGPARLKGVKKQGDAQVVLIGPQEERGALLSALTSAHGGAKVGMLLYKGGQIQLLSFDGESETKSAIFTSDLVVAWGESDTEQYADSIKKAGKKVLILKDEDNGAEQIWKALSLIRVYAKKPGKRADLQEPLILREGNTVREMCEKLRLEKKNFLFAKVWGSSARFDGQRVSLNHKLRDQDVVELNLKK